ncbi:MAG TPA: protein-glutamate O-methyltransferase CheR [Rhodanobacteraceae bacterium]|nr:protein-glutamate O-methyltransferase CheR [Rhodanobacteraceae bacterium]
MKPVPMPQAVLARVASLLADRTGLQVSAEPAGDLERVLGLIAPALGLDNAGACATALLERPWTRRHLELLVRHLTVGETYFFRDPRVFEHLERQVLPRLLQACRGQLRPLRVWSAGCCSGEEAYSLAMLLDRLWPEAGAEAVQILATDINPRFLSIARRGVYREWSLRATPAPLRERYFTLRRDGRLELQPRIRERVQFRALNLAAATWPAPVRDGGTMDLILCRNVLMYFAAPQARQVVAHLRRALAPDGWLVTSAAEASSRLFGALHPAGSDAPGFYRASAPSVPAARAAPATAAPPSQPAAARQRPRRGPLRHAPPGARAPAAADSRSASVPAAPAPVPQADRLDARQLADRGDLQQASARCDHAVGADKLDPAPLYLLASIQQEQGLDAQARVSLERVLYLDPEFALAHLALANLHRRNGRAQPARRHFEAALRSLRARPQDELVAESGGLSAGRLADIVAALAAADGAANDSGRESAA